MHRITRGWVKAAGIALALCLSPATAQEGESLASMPLQPYNDISLYQISWSGVPAGMLLIDAEETADSYHINVLTKSTGPMRPILKHNGDMSTQGIKKNGAYLPQHSKADFKLRGKTRDIKLDFDSSGKLVYDLFTPVDPEWKRPKVPQELKQDALDPLTAFYAHRPLIHNALRDSQERFTLRYYDGRRLTDLHYHVTGVTTQDINGKKTPVLGVTVTREPIAGYRDKELKKMQGKDMSLQLYFSTDGKMIPLRFVVDAPLGAFYAAYIRSCATFEECAERVR